MGKICIALQAAIKHCRDTGGNDVDGLRHDIRNIVPHVFGEHAQCRDYFCNKNASTSYHSGESALSNLRINDKVYDAVCKIMERVAVDADRLRLGMETNIAERAFSSDAKFVAGKRQNLSNLGSYQRRFNMMVLLHNEGYGWSREVITEFTHVKPGAVFEKYAADREDQKFRTVKSKSRPGFVRSSKCSAREDTYGEAAMQLQREVDDDEKATKIAEYLVRVLL